MMPVALCIHFPFAAPCDDILIKLVYATSWLSMHPYTLAYMFMHESCLLVCRPCFNTMKLWTFDPNLHLSFADTTFCLSFCLFVFFLVFLLACLPSCFLVFCLSCGLSCLLPCALLAISTILICFMPLPYALCIFFFPLLISWFLVFAFACTHMEQGHMELGHSLPGTSKKGEDASMWI